MIISLVGYAGSGKSSLGKRLARRLGVDFVDTDKYVERMVGATIADIFLYEGEEYFRRSERAAVEAIVEGRRDVVVATGGGLPTWGDNMERLKECGMTVYLRRAPEQILARLTDYVRCFVVRATRSYYNLCVRRWQDVSHTTLRQPSPSTVRRWATMMLWSI